MSFPWAQAWLRAARPAWPCPDAVNRSCRQLQSAPGLRGGSLEGLNFAEFALTPLPRSGNYLGCKLYHMVGKGQA